jgi:NAD(P)-binding Rossmann-like domain
MSSEAASPISTFKDRIDVPVVVVGNCIAAMIAALEISRRGVQVAVVNPSPNWGGHFSSKQINGSAFDLGMVGFEFTGFHKNPTRDVLQYDAHRRNDVARFCQLSQEYVESLIPVSLARAPLMIWNAKVHADLLMGNDLSVLKDLPEVTVRQIEEEVNKILANPDNKRHASKKVDNPVFLDMSFEEASIANHGRTFHELFIAPFADKLFPGGASRFSAIYHRCLWMPLYYPETLIAAIGSRPHDLTTHFHYPAAGRIGALAETILDHLNTAQNVQIHNAAITSLTADGSYSLSLADGSLLETGSLLWGLDLAHLLRVSKTGDRRHHEHNFSKSSVTFGFFGVERKKLRLAFSSLFVLDPRMMIYRISNLSDAAGTSESEARLVMECNSHFSSETESNEAIKDRICFELKELGLIDEDSAIISKEAYTIKNVMPVPNKIDHEAFWESFEVVRGSLPGVKLIGPSNGYLITTLNDQVIQGLKAAEEHFV